VPARTAAPGSQGFFTLSDFCSLLFDTECLPRIFRLDSPARFYTTTLLFTNARTELTLPLLRACAEAGEHAAKRANQMGRLDERVAVVTGAGSGIGRATAELFAQEGARVVAVDRPGVPHSSHAGITGFECDLLEDGAPRAVREAVESGHGRADILFANAGISGFKRLQKLTDEEWDRIMGVNLRAAFRLTQSLEPMIAQSKNARIIYTSSLAAMFSSDGLAAYAASKAGLLGLMRALAWELGPRGVTVNAILPGSVVTPMTSAALGKEDVAKNWSEKIALRRLAQPIDIARVALFLASDDGGYVTGQPIIVDGGQSIRM
jgi:3-oxoacyl-[acyl-carrier protein] reductase